MDKISLMLKNGFSSDMGIGISFNNMKAGDIWNTHWHDYFELEIITDGSAEHIYNNNKYIINSGSAYLMTYYDFHSIRALTDLKIISICFDESILDLYLTEYILKNSGRLRCEFDSNNLKKLKDSANDIYEEIKASRHFGREMLKSRLSDIVITLIRKSSCEIGDTVPQLIQKAVAYIYEHFRTNLTLKSVAGEMYVSPNYLGSYFKKNMGISFNGYLNMLRLKYACNLLSNSFMTVKEVAFASGYSSEEYFIYSFKHYLGTTPSHYRKD